MKRAMLLGLILLAPLCASAQEELTTTAPVYTTPATSKFVVSNLLLDDENERVVGQLVNEVKTVGDPGKPGTLTTRTSNQAGVVTMSDAAHGIVTGQEINVAWAGGLFRRNMIAGTVAGAVIPISGGKGDQLPVLNAAVTAPAMLTRTFGVKLPPIEWNGAKAKVFLRKAKTGNFGKDGGGNPLTLYSAWLTQIQADDSKLAGTVSGTPD